MIVKHGAPWSETNPRRRKRACVVDPVAVGDEARVTGKWIMRADHGGDVANKYGYAALTECYVVVASPRGNVSVWFGELQANKVTLSGVAATCVGNEARPLWDGRIPKGSPREGAARTFLRGMHFIDHPSDDGSVPSIRETGVIEGHTADERAAVEIGIERIAAELTTWGGE